MEISGIQDVLCNEQNVKSARPEIGTLKESKHLSLTFNELESDVKSGGIDRAHSWLILYRLPQEE